ncbi:DUF2628 domain-containing protein [Priestia flexa]|uniref:DUF2628 domain-containing protein n=1 Tax=Priestia flexa TaxID=86664 RepID=UPI000C241DE2|nr:DUF2628 domain-containing protein [Priestia flexa]MEC0668051.1 DUF2628 domain-containing protein [Priestia flexa]MED3825820.1 DUF2628 domain-containing protein [Priestia flexa]
MLDSTIHPLSFDAQHKVVQTNTSYYHTKWSSVTDPAKNNSWNWMAFLFFPFWLAYRKLYKIFLIIALIDIPLLVATYIIDIPFLVELLFYLVIAIVIGINANRWYYKHAFKLVQSAMDLPEEKQILYLKDKGGTHMGSLIGLNALVIAFSIGADYGLSYLPTKTNAKDIMKYSDEGITLEAFTDNPTWTYIKKEDNHHIIQFKGYDYAEKEHVRILFYTYIHKQVYEWHEVYINGKKLSDEEAEEYEYWIEDNTWY